LLEIEQRKLQEKDDQINELNQKDNQIDMLKQTIFEIKNNISKLQNNTKS
jgi:hypothetical protein